MKDEKIGVEKLDTDSLLVKDQLFRTILEYAPNKMFVAGNVSNMFLFEDWTNVRCIQDPNFENIDKNVAYLLSDFHVDSFPFIAVCGQSSLSLLNVKDCSFQPLITQQMSINVEGI